MLISTLELQYKLLRMLITPLEPHTNHQDANYSIGALILTIQNANYSTRASIQTTRDANYSSGFSIQTTQDANYSIGALIQTPQYMFVYSGESLEDCTHVRNCYNSRYTEIVTGLYPDYIKLIMLDR